MEKIYGCGGLDYTSEPVRLQDFMSDAVCVPHPFVHGTLSDRTSSENEGKSQQEISRERISEMMGITLTDSELIDLEQICSPENLRIDTAQPQLDVKSVRSHTQYFNCVPVPDDTQLETLQFLKTRNRIHERFLKYSGSIWLDKMVASTCSDDTKKHKAFELVPGKELVALVRLYIPFQHDIGVRNHRVAVGCQELIILGRQTLADLRDHFFCSCDHAICQDLSNHPARKPSQIAKDIYKSGMMYIENVFYNDTRFSSNINYSDVVLAWAKERNFNLGTTAKMEDTKISDLTVRLGYPYLYQHQGSCEHLFCFSDIRLLHQSDPLQLLKYPLLRTICKRKSRYCMMCGQYIAKWITVGNERVPHDPCYFCQQCFLSYNYIKKKKIGDFAAYPFFETSQSYLETKSD